MVLGSSRFIEFAKNVMSAARNGGLRASDLRKLRHLLSKTGKRNRVLAQGILAALSAGGSSKEDIKRFSELLEMANHRIAEEKEPFTPKQQEELNKIFRKALISKKTARWFSTQLDELVAEEINSFILGEKRPEEKKLIEGVPEKKTVKITGAGPELKRKEKIKL